MKLFKWDFKIHKFEVWILADNEQHAWYLFDKRIEECYDLSEHDTFEEVDNVEMFEHLLENDYEVLRIPYDVNESGTYYSPKHPKDWAKQKGEYYGT